MGIENRVALITGSASGIGRRIALTMARAGAAVVINDIVPQAVTDTVAEFEKEDLRVMGFKADITDPDQVARMMETTVEKFGGLDILVNNAGMEKAGALRKLTLDDFRRTIDVNLTGAFLCSQAAHGHMINNNHGRIINIASRAWLGGPGQSPYASAKAGLVGLTRTLALELGRKGVTVNCIAPGLIDTPLWQKLPEKSQKYLLSKQPTGKLGRVEDVAGAVMFMADDRASFITGQVLYVCGGRSLFAG